MAKILDPPHPELSYPIHVPKGRLIKIIFPDKGEEDRLWRGAAKKDFLTAYEAEDAIYNKM